MIEKRKRNAEDKGDRNGSNKSRSNPWLVVPSEEHPKHCNNCTRQQEDDIILNHVLLFMDLTKRPNETIVSAAEPELLPVVTILLTYLGSNCDTGDTTETTGDTETSTGALVSTQDVAKLLLSWATKQLVYKANNTTNNPKDETTIKTTSMYWTALCKTCQHLHNDSNSKSFLSQTFTQSILNKLVLFAVLTANVTTTPAATTSFCFMMDHFYRPTMDVAVKIIMVELSKIALSPQQPMVLSMFRLLQNVQQKANPKTTFLVFSDPVVLEAISKLILALDTAQEQWIWDIFFHPTHHLDGFRSFLLPNNNNSNNKTFKCYQDDFCKTIQKLISDSDNNNTIVLQQLIPMLVKGFFQTTLNAWSKRHSVHETASIQFQFWANLAEPLLLNKKNEKNTTSALLKTLHLVLEYNVYLPSFQDKRHFLFLQSMLIQLIPTSPDDAAERHHPTTESLAIINICIQLNHHVVHDRLSAFLSFLFTSGNIDNITIISTVFCTIVKTYHDLRQLDYFFEAMVGMTTSTSTTLDTVFAQHNVVETLSMAITDCPPGQVRQLFQTLNTYIVTTTNGSGKTNNVVTFLFVLLLQHVSVDAHSAATVSYLCKTTLNGSVTTLLNKEDASSTCQRQGLELCGWTLDLKTRCAFWLGGNDDNNNNNNDDVDDNDVSHLDLLHKASTHAAINGKVLDTANTKELQFLACYRIQQLHSLIHKSQQQAMGSCPTTASFDSEAQGLVNFIFVSLSIDNSMNYLTQNGWILLSKFVHLWVHYAQPSQIEVFVAWTISTIISDRSSDTDIGGLKENANVSKMVVKSLLRDASFFEVEQVASLIGRIGIAQLADLYGSLLCNEPKNAATSYDTVTINKVSLTCSVQDTTNWKSAPTHIMANLSRSTHSIPKNCSISTHADERTMVAKSILSLVAFLNDVPGRLARSDDLSTLFESLLRVHVLTCSILKSLSSNQNSKMNPLTELVLEILGSLRGVASRLILEDQGQKQIKSELISSLICGVIHAHLSIATVETAYNNEDHKLCTRTNKLLEYATMLLITGHGDDGISAIMEIVESLAKDSRDHFLLHPIISSLLKSDYGSNKVISEKFGRVVTLFHDAVHRVNVQTTTEFDVFLTDLFRVSAKTRDKSFREMEKLVQIATEDAHMIRSTEERAHLLSCLVVAGSGNDLIEICEGLYMKASEQEHPCLHLIDAIFGTLILQEGDDECGEISDLLERLESPSSINQTWIVSHMFCIIIRNADDKELREKTIAKYARRYFFRGLQLLRRPNNLRDSTQLERVQQGEAMIIELTKHKDIISIRERDLALLLSQMCLLLGPVSTNADPIPTEIFATAYKIVSTLLQRFPKQLYTCAPSVMSTFRLLLRHVLYCPDTYIESRALMLSRLCEFLLPHQDVFKKHVLVLLLEYISALKGDTMSAVRKGAITPAIFSLLETLSPFERQQLNALTDATGKLLFSSSYTSYQKGQYKGQY